MCVIRSSRSSSGYVSRSLLLATGVLASAGMLKKVRRVLGKGSVHIKSIIFNVAFAGNNVSTVGTDINNKQQKRKKLQ